ncbi:uncharacterized protein LY79DRAFT_670829 [Colletotrichum navitas]|uniref:Uncharacterized protein n=1 Tax=Colletotrichum navitas TaxID=681940 RepID=A0AAD8PW78_9PEZI|nr:uncharacterized protein LY79DRAFT_670829 [Colletotrichum navitas]KAK1585827.1 hypothetical protein LY79DRAFT_670829 [Colletotrichum navitas]
MDSFPGVFGTELLGSHVTEDLKAADILVKIHRVTAFWLRYESLRHSAGEDALQISVILRWPKTHEMIRQVRMMGNMRHVEVLEILDQTVETMTKKEFTVDYFKLDWEVQTFVERLRMSMFDACLLSSPEDGVDKFIEKPGATELLGLAIEKAFLATAHQLNDPLK